MCIPKKATNAKMTVRVALLSNSEEKSLSLKFQFYLFFYLLINPILTCGELDVIRHIRIRWSMWNVNICNCDSCSLLQMLFLLRSGSTRSRLVYYTFSSVWVAEWLPLGNSCPLVWPFVLIVFCLFVVFGYFPFWFWEQDLPSDCSSSCSVLSHIFHILCSCMND